MAVFWIIAIIEIISYTIAGNGQCASSTNIVAVCTNSTVSYKQINIPVNGGMDDGCQCDVTLVETPSETGNNRVEVSNMVDQTECGYKVVNYKTPNNDSWTCSNSDDQLYILRLNESFQLTFTRDSTPEPTSTGFCLHLTTTINTIDTNNRFTITCWRNDDTPASTNTAFTHESTTATTPTVTDHITASPITTTRPTTTSPNVPVTSSTQKPSPTSSKTTSQIVPGTSTTTSSRTQASVSEAMTVGGSTSTSSETSVYGGSTEKVTGIPDAVIIGGGVAGACLLLIIIIVIIVCLIKRRKNNQYHKPSTRTNEDTGYEDVHPEEPIMMENDLRTQGTPNSNTADQERTQTQDGMIYLENDLYVSADSFADNSTPTSLSPTSPNYTDIDDFPGQKPDKVHADASVDKNPNVNNVYAVVNKKPKTERTDGETNNHKDENQPGTFSVGQGPISNNIYAAVSKPPKNEKKDNSREEPNHQASVHNGENPPEIFSVSQTPNPNNVYAVVNKKPKVTDKPSETEAPPKPGKPPKPDKAVKPQVPVKPSTEL